MSDEPAPQPDSLEDRFLGWGRVRDLTGLSRTTAWRLQRIGQFPDPVRISPSRVAWRESELLAWKVARAAKKQQRKPSLRPARVPKLPGLVRPAPTPKTVVSAPPVPPVQPRLDLQPKSQPPSPVIRSRPRSRSRVCPGQIDFGF
ncbi:helix-turn-helix transcriptional regulator [Brevundimonas sp.]